MRLPFDPLGDLNAEQMRILRLAFGSWEQPICICSAKNRGAVLLHIFIDQPRHIVVELEGQIDPVLDVVVGKHQQVV